ncbi:MAG: GNAT family N-acetyltransferase [Gaiellaceae bacterium]
MELRQTVVDDLPELHALFLAAIGEVYRRHAFDPPAPPLAVFQAQQGHILETGLAVVAVDGDEPVGFGSAWTRGDEWFLASLFVAPGAQARRLGSVLLDAVWGEGHARRRTITDAIQPVSNALYARRGLVPATPLLVFEGLPAGAAAILESAGRGDATELSALDAAAYGFDRALDHPLWERAARRTLWRRAGEPVAYSYAFPGGSLGPIAGVDPAAAAAALESELARAAVPVTLRIPGSSRSLVEVALRCRLRLTPTPGLLLGSRGTKPPVALAIGGYTLF